MNLPYTRILRNGPVSASDGGTIGPHGVLWSMAQRLTKPLRIAPHFLDRLRERFPEARLTEGKLSEELAQADWYAAGGSAYYAVRRLGAQLAVLVVKIHEDLVDVVTIYEPKPGWERRLGHVHPWPAALVVATAA